jgi:hypothetical protein
MAELLDDVQQERMINTLWIQQGTFYEYSERAVIIAHIALILLSFWVYRHGEVGTRIATALMVFLECSILSIIWTRRLRFLYWISLLGLTATLLACTGWTDRGLSLLGLSLTVSTYMLRHGMQNDQLHIEELERHKYNFKGV